MQFSIWLLIWIIVSIGLLGFSIWTFIILMRQKKSWRDFAKKHKLRYSNASLMVSPKVSGIYKEYSVSVFTGHHESERGASNRQLTAIEIALESKMPIAGAVASGAMVGIVQELDYSEEHVPNYKFWNSDNITRSEDKHIMAEYLDETRAKALCDLMDNKKFWVIFIFRGNDTILRIDTPDPFDNEEKLTKTIDNLIDVAKLLELKKGESGRLKTEGAKRSSETARVDIEDDQMEALGLELEEDEEQDAESNKDSAEEQPDKEKDQK